MTLSPHAVVVGIDLSGTAEPALEWAAAEAHRRGLPLRIVHAYPPPTYPSTGSGLLPGGTVVGLGEALRKVAVDSVSECADRVQLAHPDLVVHGHVRCGSGAATLVEASRSAALVVVGARGLGSVAGAVLGSVSMHVCAHASSPVVVVREPSHARTTAPVVVGIDGTASSREALAFAVAEASSRGVGLTVVHTWRAGGDGGDWAPEGWSAGSPGLPAAEAALVSEAVAGLGEQYPDVEIRRMVSGGDPTETLEHVSRAACLVVVGTRGRGIVAGWLTGSVSRAVLRSAHCPVAVVHPTLETDRPADDPQASASPGRQPEHV